MVVNADGCCGGAVVFVPLPPRVLFEIRRHFDKPQIKPRHVLTGVLREPCICTILISAHQLDRTRQAHCSTNAVSRGKACNQHSTRRARMFQTKPGARRKRRHIYNRALEDLQLHGYIFDCHVRFHHSALEHGTLYTLLLACHAPVVAARCTTRSMRLQPETQNHWLWPCSSVFRDADVPLCARNHSLSTSLSTFSYISGHLSTLVLCVLTDLLVVSIKTVELSFYRYLNFRALTGYDIDSPEPGIFGVLQGET